MKVLFASLDPLDPLEPYLRDVIDACGSDHSVVVAQTETAFVAQLQGVGVVVDLGGASNGILAAAGEAGVQLWQVLGYGLDGIDVDFAVGAGMSVAHTPGSHTAVPLAEHALMLILALAKRLSTSRQYFEDGRFFQPVASEISGKTLGLVGFGASARELAIRARACGMRVAAVDAVQMTDETRAHYGLEFLGRRDDLLKLAERADYISIHVPLTNETLGLIDAAVLARMKPSSHLVNVSRGAVIDEEALLVALSRRSIAGAGLDVFEEEPLPVNHPLRFIENTILTPHIAGVTHEAARRKAGVVAENIHRISIGEALLHTVSRNLRSLP